MVKYAVTFLLLSLSTHAGYLTLVNTCTVDGDSTMKIFIGTETGYEQYVRFQNFSQPLSEWYEAQVYGAENGRVYQITNPNGETQIFVSNSIFKSSYINFNGTKIGLSCK